MFAGVKVTPTGGDPTSGVARAMRTAPPPGVPGVSSLTYSGTHPLSRWALSDPALPLPVTVYAYSTLKPGDMVASGVPAVGACRERLFVCGSAQHAGLTSTVRASLVLVAAPMSSFPFPLRRSLHCHL